MPLPFPNGKPVLQIIIESLKKTALIDKIVVATSSKKEDDGIEKLCLGLGTDVFRGDQYDVQSRFISIAENYSLDHIIRCTGDNPVVDLHYLRKALESHLEGKFDYTKTSGLPLGTNFEIVKAELLIARKFKRRSYNEKEHVTFHINRSGDFVKNYLAFNCTFSNIRMTLDYPQDYAFLSMLFSIVGQDFDLSRIQPLIERYPWLFSLNDTMIQKSTTKSSQV